MKEIKLKSGQITLVDDEDFEYLNQWKWTGIKNRENATMYVVRYDYTPIIHNCVRMHRLIMETPDNMQVDHIDHNGLNNQKSNLRNCNQSQNQANRKAYGTSKYLGVNFYKWGSTNNRYRAAIQRNGKIMHIGYFRTEEEAARAYDEKSKAYSGEFAKLNFKD